MIALGAGGLASCTHQNHQGIGAGAVSRPNLLMILVDDLNGSLGCYGNAIVRSPNIDGLAGRGVKFERAYCQYPVCNPSRTSILSGLRPSRTGVMSNSSHVVPDRNDPHMLPRFLKEQGYFSVRVGKVFHDSRRMLEGKPMHSTDDPGGWDISEDEPGANEPDESATASGEEGEGQQSEEAPRKIVKLDEGDERTGDGFVARRVVQIMQEKVAKDRPFFLAAGFRKPHPPWAAPRKYFDLYAVEKIQPPPVPAEHLKSLLAVAVNKSAEQEVSAQQAKEFIAAYYACVSFMDAQVGVILRGLERMKRAQNTLVIFMGDHGFALGEHGLWGKSTLFEQSVRTPLIVAGPGVSPGQCSRTVELVDVYPTVVEMCGLAKVESLQGVSLRALLERPDAPWDRPARTSLRHERVLGKSVRTEQYRYTEWNGGKEGMELYDYGSDANEFVNLAGDPGAAAVVASMKSLLK
jgi:iduronate 2-sulfatase